MKTVTRRKIADSSSKLQEWPSSSEAHSSMRLETNYICKLLSRKTLFIVGLVCGIFVDNTMFRIVPYHDVAPVVSTKIMKNDGIINSPSTSTIKSIRLIGERNSGTSWTIDFLNECFNHTLPVRHSLTRYKHFFQTPYDPISKKPIEDVLVVAMFRDPYRWVRGMMAKPHHAPLHLHLDWKEFVGKPWTMQRHQRDLDLVDKMGTKCQYSYHYNEIIPCLEGTKEDYNISKSRFSNHKPQYELKADGSGDFYESILDLRRDKILNFVRDVPDFPFVKEYIAVNYEDLVHRGNKFLINKVEALTGTNASCHPTPSQEGRKKRRIEKDFVLWMNSHVDWDVERLVNYKKVNVKEHFEVLSSSS